LSTTPYDNETWTRVLRPSSPPPTPSLPPSKHRHRCHHQPGHQHHRWQLDHSHTITCFSHCAAFSLAGTTTVRCGSETASGSDHAPAHVLLLTSHMLVLSPPLVCTCVTCVRPYTAGAEGNFSNTTCPRTASRAADRGRLLLTARRFADVGSCAMRVHSGSSGTTGRRYRRRAVLLLGTGCSGDADAGKRPMVLTLPENSTAYWWIAVVKEACTGYCAFIRRDESQMLLGRVHARRSTVLCTCVR